MKGTLNQRIHYMVFLIWHYCISGCFITVKLINLCDLSLQHIAGLARFTAVPFPQSSDATKYCSVCSLSSEELRSLGTKLQISLIWSACTCLYLSEAEKRFWSAFSYYLTNDTEFFQAVRSPQHLFFQCSEMSVLIASVFLYKSFVFLSPPEVGTKVLQSFSC